MSFPFKSRIQKSLHVLLMIGFFILIHPSSVAQEDFPRQTIIRNYSFEGFDVVGRLISWNPQNTRNQYHITPHTDSRTGNLSMKITPKPDAEEDLGVGLCNTVITKANLFGKKTLTIKAYIKTEDLAGGIASLWMQLNGSTGIIADKNSDNISPTGTTDWKQYTIELPLTSEVNSVGFGCKMTGSGIAWYDDFEVLLDGEVLR